MNHHLTVIRGSMQRLASSKQASEIQCERVPCPRCGATTSSVVVTGEDYLHKIPGNYCVSECGVCAFWFTNPRPKEEEIPKMYPEDYGPHAVPSHVSDRLPIRTSKGVGDWFRRNVFSRFRLLEMAKRSGVLRRTFKAATRTDYLVRRLGYSHLENDPAADARSSSRSIFDYGNQWCATADLLPYFIPDGKLLEIGCATGDTLENLRRIGWKHLHGIELVPSAAECARAKGFNVECGRVEESLLRFSDAFFDVISSSFVLEHLPNPFMVIRYIADKLKPGGEFLFSTDVRDSLEFRIYGGFSPSFDFPRHLVHFCKKDIVQMLDEQFQDIECVYQYAPQDYIRPSLWRIERGVGKPLDRLVILLERAHLLKYACRAFARMHLTSRVSVRCKRKPTAT